MRARVSIYNYDRPFHDKVNVYVDIAGVPAKGSLFYLNEIDCERLLDLITQDHETASMWDIYYYGFNIQKMTPEEFELTPLSEIRSKASLGDYFFICDVGYEWNGHEYELCIDLATSENPND